MPPTLKLRVGKNRNYVSPTSRQVLALVGLSVEGAGQKMSSPIPLDLVLLVDCSGSMGEKDSLGKVKLDGAIDGLWTIAQGLQPNDTFSVIGFDETARVVLNRTTGTSQNKTELLQNRQSVETLLRSFGGVTNVYDALKLAQQTLTSAQAAGTAQRIVMLSDGANNHGHTETECINLAQYIGQSNIVIDALGYGYSDLRLDFLTSLSIPTGGDREHVIGTPNKILESIFSRAKKAIASNVKFIITFPPSVLVGEYMRYEPSVAYLGKVPVSATQRSLIIQAGQYELDKEYSWLFEIEVPSNVATTTPVLMDVQLHYVLPNGVQQQESAQLTVQLTEDPAKVAQIDGRYMAMYQKAKLNRFEVELGRAQAVKDRAQMERVLRSMLEHCRSVGLMGEAQEYERQLSALRSGRGLDELAIETAKSTTQVGSITSRVVLTQIAGRTPPPPPPRHMPSSRLRR